MPYYVFVSGYATERERELITVTLSCMNRGFINYYELMGVLVLWGFEKYSRFEQMMVMVVHNITNKRDALN